MSYIHQRSSWPNFRWDSEVILPKVSMVRDLQGRLIGRMQTLGFELQEEAVLETLTEDILKTSAIEGERLDANEVRSSVARRLGMDISGLDQSNRDVEGIVEVMLDATQNYEAKLTKDRLCDWHAALFPTGRSGMQKITVGAWRNDAAGPMYVLSGPMGREKVHFEAPPAERLDDEMDDFLKWVNANDSTLDPVLKSAIGHLWAVTIHPFDDGNGRISRAIADLLLARADRTNQRFYSMSSEIERSKKKYYDILESTQKGGMDITNWLVWYMDCLAEALKQTNKTLSRVLVKAKFWEIHRDKQLNERQRKMVNKLHDDFFGKLTSSKWAKMTQCSKITANRDIDDLIKKGILEDSGEGGRSTNYLLVLPKVD